MAKDRFAAIGRKERHAAIEQRFAAQTEGLDASGDCRADAEAIDLATHEARAAGLPWRAIYRRLRASGYTVSLASLRQRWKNFNSAYGRGVSEAALRIESPFDPLITAWFGPSQVAALACCARVVRF